MLGGNVVIPLPDTALWQDVGLGFAARAGAGLPALLIGWLGGVCRSTADVGGRRPRSGNRPPEPGLT